MRQVFLDCGAHCGCSRRKWEKHHTGYEIYSFEADPELCGMNPLLINKAVSTTNGVATFYKFGIDGGSSLEEKRAEIMKVRKPNYFPLEKITVPTFDLNEFILTSFTQKDYIVLKLDIEGAEYEVLPHLIAGGSIELVFQIFIEWHDFRVGVDPNVNVELTRELQSRLLTPQEWDAMEPEFCIVKDDEERKKYHSR